LLFSIVPDAIPYKSRSKKGRNVCLKEFKW